MTQQTSIDFDPVRGHALAEAGLSLAVETADKKQKDWSKLCWQLFLVWLRRKKHNEPFMIESFRKYLDEYGLLELPPSNRVFGFLAVRAQKEGFIKCIGTARVSNRKAHRARAGLWIKK